MADLPALARGYVQAALESIRRRGRGDAFQAKLSMLAPETLDAILKDCAAETTLWAYAHTEAGGAAFWRDRQAAFSAWRRGTREELCEAFPAVTLTRCADGQIRQVKATGAQP